MELKKGLKLLDTFCISTGAMLSGLFILPGLAYAEAGPLVLWGYLIAAVLSLTGLFSQAELSSAMPKAGGTYFYVTRSLGPAVGTIYGLITWLSMSLKSAYELLFMATAIGLLLHFNATVIAMVLCVAFLVLNLVGAKEAGRIQVFIVIAILVLLAFFAINAYPVIDVHNFDSTGVKGLGDAIGVAGFVFVSFGGLLKVASIAEEVKDPGRVLPRSMLAALAVVSLAYLTVVFVCIGVMGPELANPELVKTPVSSTAAVVLGRPGQIVFSITALLAIVSSANAGVMAASRYPLALARDEMLPEFLTKINHRFNTPHMSLLLTGLVIIIALFADIHFLVKAASTVLILTYVFTCIAVIILRESQVQNYQPQFRSPWYPWMQVAGVVGFDVLLFGMGLEALLTTSGLIVLGFLAYWFYGRKRQAREYALLHLIERITSRQMTSHHLENELKEIIHERDEILKDRFDHLIEACPVIDVEGPLDKEDFFQKASEVLAKDLHIDSRIVHTALIKREQESSTVLTPFLAIPHLVIEGDSHFDILLARCKEGIHFNERGAAVTAVFVLIGTRDERPFHLTSLAAIAQIIQDETFEKRWMAAKTEHALRDIILLGKRTRHV